MKTRLGTARVLIAADKQAVARQVFGLLSEHFELLRTTTDPDRAIQDIADYKPHVLVLAFESLDEAKSYYLGLLRSSLSLPQLPHRAVVLCNKQEVREAFDLCKKQYFDDYVLYWPQAQDGLRLAMSIWIAGREMTTTSADLARRVGLLAHDRLGAESGESGAGKNPADEAPGEVQQGTGTVPALEFTSSVTLSPQSIRPIVMVVEDDELTRILLERTLDSTAYEVVFVNDGDSALSQVKRVKPDLVLMDIRLPGTDGITLTRQLTASAHFAQIPIVIMTGDSRRETLLRSVQAGAADFVAKPFTRELLREKLRRLLPEEQPLSVGGP